uniref:VIT domain-containing protein n=1 Tax=Gopherus evgoodei TaxID=1825980 RepID=A0A8C4YQ10_9SAUR
MGVCGEAVADIPLPPVPLRSSSVSMLIRGFVADVGCELLYRNEEPGPMEAVFKFPVDAEAAVYAFQARLGGACIQALLHKKKQVLGGGPTAPPVAPLCTRRSPVTVRPTAHPPLQAPALCSTVRPTTRYLCFAYSDETHRSPTPITVGPTAPTHVPHGETNRSPCLCYAPHAETHRSPLTPLHPIPHLFASSCAAPL